MGGFVWWIFFHKLSYRILLSQIIELVKCRLLWRIVPGFTNSSRAFPIGCCRIHPLRICTNTSKASVMLIGVSLLTSAEFRIFHVTLKRDLALQLLFFVFCT